MKYNIGNKIVFRTSLGDIFTGTIFSIFGFDLSKESGGGSKAFYRVQLTDSATYDIIEKDILQKIEE